MTPTARQRYRAVMDYEPVDRIPDIEFGYWMETLTRWHAEGLPEHITDNDPAHEYFGIDLQLDTPVTINYCPSFVREVIEDRPRSQIIRDELATVCEIPKGGQCIPHYLKFPVESEGDFDALLDRLNGKDKERLGSRQVWNDSVRLSHTTGHIVGLGLGGFYSFGRMLMGMENFSMALYEHPKLVRRMMQTRTQMLLDIIELVLADSPAPRIDMAMFWEDMCFNHGPLCSPAMFREFCLPGYKTVTARLRDHGIDISYVDCDGLIFELVEAWLEGGVQVMMPCERASGSDPRELRRRFGKRVLLQGGVDKRALAKGPKAIDAHLEELVPLAKEGGYVPHVDHRVPPDVSLADYLYYVRRKREIFGIKG